MWLPCGVGEKVGRVDHRREVETLGRCRWTGVGVVLETQQRRHVLERPAAQPDVYHGADQHPDHTLEESVGLDLEAHAPAVSLPAPVRLDYPAAIVRFIGFGRESAEIVLTPDHPGSCAEQLEVERFTQRPLELPPKRRSRGLIETDAVEITSRKRGLAGMESGLHQVNRFHPAITRQQGIERPAKRRGGPGGRCAEADALAHGVDPSIGTAGRVAHGPALKETLEDALELDLNRAPGGLALPPDKAGAVVL